ncbi:hypothetical protein OAM67_01410 [bacterium]|nr:hypothetical protein [bacterium]
MSCFWDGLVRKVPELRKFNASNVIAALKAHNILTPNVKVNGQKLTKQRMEENMEWIKDYSEQGYNQGHFTAGEDPFLILICEAFSVNIEHSYAGHVFKFVNSRATTTLKFQSSTSHFT